MDAVIDYVKKSDELYVFGPAEAKTQLKKRILEEHIIAPEKLKAVVTSDKMTVNQMVAKVKEFYHL
jgi:stalled ribosome rescue protein Dom34